MEASSQAAAFKVVVASARYRAHYLEWFRDAFARLDLRGEVIALEFRADSASFTVADRAVAMPAYNDPAYPGAMRSWFAAERPDLFLSLNDYEHAMLASGLAGELRAGGCTMAILDADRLAIVADKLAMVRALREHGVRVPSTFPGSEAHQVAAAHAESEFVVKHRFGSGSTGLRMIDSTGLEAAVADAAESALDMSGRSSAGDLDHVVIQERVHGDEYGVDGVFSVDGRSTFLGALARRKLRMRSGDTEVATTVDPAPFEELVRRVGQAIQPSAVVDMDVIVGADGLPHVIDINPRFGGGYPFVHIAGADVPALLVRMAAGLGPDPTLLRYETGVTSVRREAFGVLSRSATP
jgi:carbamoyl-phosphate synthase large subunit